MPLRRCFLLICAEETFSFLLAWSPFGLRVLSPTFFSPQRYFPIIVVTLKVLSFSLSLSLFVSFRASRSSLSLSFSTWCLRNLDFPESWGARNGLILRWLRLAPPTHWHWWSASTAPRLHGRLKATSCECDIQKLRHLYHQRNVCPLDSNSVIK